MNVTEDAAKFELVEGSEEPPELPVAEEEPAELPVAEEEEPAELPQVAPPEGLFRKLITFAFGVVGLIAGMAVLAAIPVLQFMTLGWMLEAEGRLARGEGWRSCLPGLRKASRIGSSVIGLAILIVPVLVVHHYYLDARLIAPGSDQVAFFYWLRLGFALPFAFQGIVAIARGGRLIHFFRPLNNLIWLISLGVKGGPSLGEVGRTCVAFVKDLRLPHYLVLGVKGFVAGVLWLAIPSTLLVLGGKAPPLFLLGLLFMPAVLPYALVGQARLAATGEFKEAFQIGPIRRRVRRAPFSHTFALIVVLGLALPLYLLKLEELDRDALWILAGFFVASAIPGRLLTGWAHWRAREGKRANWFLRFLCWNTRLAAGGFYVFVVFVWQFFGWRGTAGIYAQHAFLVPTAFY